MQLNSPTNPISARKARNLLGLTYKPTAAALERDITDRLQDYPATPFDYMSSADAAAVRSGVNVPNCSPMLQNWLNDALLSGAAFDRAVSLYWPAGTWVVNQKLWARIKADGKYNGLHIRFGGAHACKIVIGDNNKYRFVNRGFWNAQTNEPALQDGVGVEGDTYTVRYGGIRYIGGTAVWPVGCQIHFRNGRWQKILEPARWMGYVDPNTNYGNDGPGSKMIWPDLAEYGDFYICKAYGTFMGLECYAGDEIYFLGPGDPVVKRMLGGQMMGTWSASGPLPTPTNPKQYWIVTGNASENILSGDGTMVSGSAFLRPGDKLWWSGTAWYKAYCTSNPRGAFNAVDGTYQQMRWFQSSGEYRNALYYLTNTSGGAYGDWLYARTDGGYSGAGGINGWLQDEVAWFNGDTWEKVLRDPNYDSGWLHVSFPNYKNTVSLTGGFDVISNIDTRHVIDDVANPNLGYTVGPLLRVEAQNSAINNGGLNQETTLYINGMRVQNDSANSGEAQFFKGVVETAIKTRNIYVPLIEFCEFRPPMYLPRSDTDRGTDAMVYNPMYPRVAVSAVYHEEAYVPRFDNVQCNGRWRTGLYCDSLIPDVVTGSSWEGGRATRINIAECIDGIRLQHRYRNEPTGYEPTFEINGMDGKALRYGVRIRQHQNVSIDNWQIIIEDFPKLLVQNIVAAIYCESASNIIVNGSFVTGGLNSNVNAAGQAVPRGTIFGTALLTTGACGNITLNGMMFASNGYGISPRHYSSDNTNDKPTIRVLGWSSEGRRLFPADFQLVETGPGCQPQFVYDEQASAVLSGSRNRRSIHGRSTSVGADPVVSISRDRSDWATVTQNVTMGALRFEGRSSIGALTDFAGIELVVADTNSADMKSTLQFSAMAGGSARVPFMVLDGFGNLVNFQKAVSASGGFGAFGSVLTGKPTVTGSKGGNAALASLINALAQYGLIVDNTT